MVMRTHVNMSEGWGARGRDGEREGSRGGGEEGSRYDKRPRDLRSDEDHEIQALD